MNSLAAAFWAEILKAYRARISLLTSAGFLLLPLAGGLFMLILKNPEQARSMGLISAKAQLTAGTADWPSFWMMQVQGMAIAGAILFALITSWVFGREFSDHTAKEILALPTPRWAIVCAKFGTIALWTLALTILVLIVGLGVGFAVAIPGWSADLTRTSAGTLLLTAILNLLLVPFVALFASSGRGYLPPMGWTILISVFANIVGVLGWGDWFPWTVPVLASGMVKTQSVELHSYIVLLLASIAGFAATVYWWERADQTR